MIRPPQSVRLRPASMDDADLLLDWRNDPLTRAMSFSAEPVPLADHLAWLARNLSTIRIAVANPVAGCAVAGGFSVGTVRIHAGQVSYTVAPAHRGVGFGTAIIRAVMADLPLHALVKRVNVISCKVFRSLGWSEITIDSSDPDIAVFVYAPCANYGCSP